MSLSEELVWRGLINQTTYPDIKFLDQQKVSFYHGFDASADSQTVGNLAGMMLDRLFMRHGHKAVIVAGGATSLIGDPGGKDTERPLQDEQTIAKNVAKAQEQLKKVFSGYEFKLVNNLDWTRGLTVIKFLREVGKHFSITPIIQRDYIARRLGEGGTGISYAEFSYTILQGMDYLHLFDTEGVTLQLGGSDQWGNCLSGVELIRRARGEEVHVMTTPLVVNKATGVKFGKTEGGAVWLDPQKTSPTDFYQFWVNVDDADVEDYLKIFTELSKDEIETALAQHKQNPAARKAQTLLADKLTELVHGAQPSKAAVDVTKYLTSQVSIADATEEELSMLRGEIQHMKASPNTYIKDALVETGLASSRSDAQRLIESGAIYLNGITVKEDRLFRPADFRNDRLLLRRGKAFKDTTLIELA